MLPVRQWIHQNGRVASVYLAQDLLGHLDVCKFAELAQQLDPIGGLMMFNTLASTELTFRYVWGVPRGTNT